MVASQIDRILETVLYYSDDSRKAMLQFYDDVLELRGTRILVDQAIAYRIGSSVLLIFDADETVAKRSPPPTGTSGRGHVCFAVRSEGYEDWKERLSAKGVSIIEEIEWTSPLKGRSFYFHDPAGNVLEIADQDIWP